jgi:hypothetical protein
VLAAWPSVAVSLAGDAIVGWQGQRTPTSVHATMVALRHARALHWSVATISDTSWANGEEVGPPRVAASPDGSGFVASWEDNNQLAVRASTFAATVRRWTPPVTIGSDGLWDNPVAVTAGRGGTAHLLWAHGISHYSTEMQAASFGP